MSVILQFEFNSEDSVQYLVRRATSNMLLGPDWAMNAGICEILNRDPSQSKDAIRGIKKRLKRKNAKVQLLVLTLLETIVRNCGDIVHMHIAEREVLRDMVKIVRKRKPDFHVREKILILINTWQEAFGGPKARYPHFYAAYLELLHLGIVFPQRSQSSAPVFSPPQDSENPENQKDAAVSPSEAEFPSLSLTEIQNARGVMDVLTEMLRALDSGNTEGLKQEAIVDLVNQCRTYKGRLVHLVNSTSDEALLLEGLALNDDMQRLLAKHEALVSGGSDNTEKPKSEFGGPLIDVDGSLINTGAGNQTDQGSTTEASARTDILLLAMPPSTNGQSATPLNAKASVDLLSGENLGTDENSLAIIPVEQPQLGNPVSQQDALALVEMPSQGNHTQSTYPGGRLNPLSELESQNFQSPQNIPYPYGSFSNMIPPQYEQSAYVQGVEPTWNSQMALEQQQFSPDYGIQSSSSLPPPPWEVQANGDGDVQAVMAQHSPFQNGTNGQGLQTTGSDLPQGMYVQSSGHVSAFDSQTLQSNQPVGINYQAIQGEHFTGSTGMLPQQIQPGQMVYVHPQQMYANQMLGYGYAQQKNAHFLGHRMSGLSMNDNVGTGRSLYQTPSTSQVPLVRPSKPEDKLFGDLVDIAKLRKQNPSI